MSGDDEDLDAAKDLDAAEYALGTLGPESRARIRDKLRADPVLRRAVERWEARLSALDGAAPDDSATVAPRDDLWEKVEATLDRQQPDPDLFSKTVKATEGEWTSVTAGMEKKRLLVDRSLGTESYLVRMAPGARVAAHAHVMTEECLVLSGEITIGELQLNSGDYHAVSGQTIHDEVYSETGATLYVHGELRCPTA